MDRLREYKLPYILFDRFAIMHTADCELNAALGPVNGLQN